MGSGKTGKIPVAGGAAPTTKKKNNALLWFVVFLLIVGSGVGLFFALREPPPREVNIAMTEERMMTLLEEHIARLDAPFHEARHEHRKWFYRPLEGVGPDAAPKYTIADPIPISENQDRYIFDRNAVIIKGLPCTAVHKVFDNEHRKMGDKTIDHPCKYENLIYFLNRPNVYKDCCIRCGKVYEIAASPARPDVNTEKWNPDVRKKEHEDADKKYITDIANKHQIAPAELQNRISHSLIYTAMWPENVQEIPEEERVPEYYKGTIRYLKIRYFWDQGPRIHRVKADDPNPVRFEKIWPSVNDENGHMVSEGTLHFRRGQLWLLEAEFEFRNGNLIWVSEGKPVEWVGASKQFIEVHEFVETQEVLDAKAAKEKADAEKRKKAKKSASVEPPKTEEPKPEEKK